MDESADDPAAEAITTGDPAYAQGKLHSELTPEIVAKLKDVLANGSGHKHRFVKVGDSITFSTSFLDCLASDSAPAALEDARVFFAEKTGRSAPDGPETSWNRRTKSAVVGWHTTQPITGSPSPLDTEVEAMKPAFAVVMLGTNDNDPSQTSGCAGSGKSCAYRKNLEKVIDTLLAKNIVPLVSTIPPRGNSASADARVPTMNAIVRFVAAERKVPLMDFHMALEGLPGKGLGPDGIHPNSASSACDFSASGMRHGYNVRNHLVLEALDRVRKALLEDNGGGGGGTGGADSDAGGGQDGAPTSGPIPDDTLRSVDDYTVVASALHCRDGAGTSATILETLENGAALTAVADSADAPRVQADSEGAPWLHVTPPSGTACYVSADYSLIAPK